MPFQTGKVYSYNGKKITPRKGVTRGSEFVCHAAGPIFALLYWDGRKCGMPEYFTEAQHDDPEWLEVPGKFYDFDRSTWHVEGVEAIKSDSMYGESCPFRYGEAYELTTVVDEQMMLLQPGEVPAFVRDHYVFESRGKNFYTFYYSMGEPETFSIKISDFKPEEWKHITFPQTVDAKLFIFDTGMGDYYVSDRSNPDGRGSDRYIASVKAPITFKRGLRAVDV